MSLFHQKLRDLISESGLKDYEVSKQLERGPSYISNLLRSENDPAFSVVIRLCELFDVRPNYFVGKDTRADTASSLDQLELARQADLLLQLSINHAKKKFFGVNPEPTVDDVMNWWCRNNAIFDLDDEITAFFDIYYPSDATTIVPAALYMGEDSLASRCFGFSEIEQLREIFSNLADDRRGEIVRAHRAVFERKSPALSVEDLNIALPDRRRKLKIQYKRLLLPVRNREGEEFILNHASTIN